MRDINRIEPMMTFIMQAWKEYFPDWRVMQLINNFQSWLGQDSYYLEDEDFKQKFAEFITTFHARPLNLFGPGAVSRI